VRLPKRELSESTITPLRGAFYFGEIEWERNGGMNTADVSDARPSIGHKEELKATVAAIADGKQRTAASDLRRVRRATGATLGNVEAATDSTENNDIRIEDIDDLSQPMRQPINLPT
jgi:hypothetical protein